MPRNPNKTRCTHPGCRAWAVRDPSLDGPDQPLCAAHGGRSASPESGRRASPESGQEPCPEPKRGGAPLGNQNARTHGFYVSTLDPQERADLDRASDLAGATSLDAEIIIARVALRRLLHMFRTGTTPGPDPQPLTAQDYVNVIGLAFRGCGTLSRLLRARKDLGGEGLDALQAVIDEVLDDLSEEWGRQL